MNINNNNGRGQEQVVTLESLSAYCEWLNSTYGESFLKCTSGMSGVTTMLTFTSTLGGIDSSGNPYSVSGDEIGVGKITFNRTIESSTTTTSISRDGTISIRGASAGTPKPYPRGTIVLTYSGRTFTMLDNTNTTSITGYDRINVTPKGVSPNKGLTYTEITGSTYARYFNESTMVDGIIVDGYNIGDGKSEYDDNQLVVEKDVNFGKFKYSLEVDSITVEVDAMTDLVEYSKGVIPGSNDIPFAAVYDTTNTEREPFKDFNLKNFTDNNSASGVTYSGLTVEKYGNVAVAPIKNGKRSVDVYFYSDSAYTLSSVTVTANTGASVTSSITVSPHTFTSTASTAQSGVSRIVKVTIESNGQVKFDIKQRKEVYGYFPVDVYRQGSSNYGVDANGNVSLDKIDLFVKANTTTATTTSSFYYLAQHSSGWTSNAGDNFGTAALTNGKTSLLADDKSAYADAFREQGITDQTLCGKDVYNLNSSVYDRGYSFGTYHMAYANDAYGGNSFTGGFNSTKHLFCSQGTMIMEYKEPDCTSKYFDYTYEPFESDREYSVTYRREYYKDCHAYGLTSIIRRFRKINGEFIDSSRSYSAVGDSTKISTYSTMQGTNFPKHVSGKTFTCIIDTGWWNINTIKAGDNFVSGWTTIYEASSTTQGNYGTAIQTRRNIELDKVAGNSYDGIVKCETRNDTDTYYYNIHPFYYMVDAEACNGFSSGYTFLIPNEEIDYSYGNTDGEHRFYYLSMNHYFSGLGSNQMCYKDMLIYIPNNDNFSNTRFGNTSNTGYVTTACCPEAPVQEVHWVDSYAPSADGSRIGPTPSGIAFVNNGDNGKYTYVGKGTTMETLLENFDNIPYISEPSTYSYIYGLNAINDFTGYTKNNGRYSFPGQTVYSGGTNNSSHNLYQSINYMSGYTYDLNSNFDNNFGYSIDSANYNPNEEFRAIRDTGEVVRSGSSFVYTGTSFTSVGKNGTFTDYPRGGSPRFLPVVCNNATGYDGNKALRPCSGDVTFPYWFTDITIGIRASNVSPTSFNAWEYFNIQVSVDGHDMVYSTNPLDMVNSSITNYYRVDRLTNVPIEVGTTETPYHGIYCCFYTASTLTKISDVSTDDYYQTLTIRFLFVDVYKDYFEIKIKGGQNQGTGKDFRDQEMVWRLTGRLGNKVGAAELVVLSKNGWYDYKGNNGDIEKLSCIGQLQSNSVWNHTTQTSKDFKSFTTGTSTGEEPAAHSVEVANRLWY